MVYGKNLSIKGESTVISDENTGAIALKKGFHPVRIEYFEKQGAGRLRIFVKNREDENWKPLEGGGFFH